MNDASIFSLPPGSDFAAEFARGYHERYKHLSFRQRAQARVLVNTSRMSQDITAALADEAPQPGAIPAVQMIQSLDDQVELGVELAEPVSAMRRTLALARLVEGFLSARKGHEAPAHPTSMAIDLAEELAFLIDQFHDSGVDFHRLREIEVAQGAARHWQDSLEFFEIVMTHWPLILAEAEGGRLDPRDRHSRIVDAQISSWQRCPPDVPVIAAGSTGSVGTTARLLAAVAKLPMGAVVLPGFDPTVDPEIWKAAEADHPLGPFQGLFSRLTLSPSDVRPWRQADPPRRLSLLTQAMRPAPVTDHWHRLADTMRNEAGPALSGLSLIEADTPRLEANAIAVAVREALEDPSAHVALITSDGALARRVTAALARYGIVPDDTMGTPLSQSVPGTLLALGLSAAAPNASALDIAALMHHPLVQPGVERSDHLSFARTYERRVLRGLTKDSGSLPSDPEANDAEVDWLRRINAALEPARKCLATMAGLDEQAAASSSMISALTDPGSGSPAFLQIEGGPDLDDFLREIVQDGAVFGSPKASADTPFEFAQVNMAK